MSPFPRPTLVRIQAQTLAAAAASITFSSIPQTFSHLRLIVVGRTDLAATESDYIQVQVNGDTGNHYDVQAAQALNTAVAAGVWGATNRWLGLNPDFPGASATAGVAGQLELELPYYANTTFQKTGLWRSGFTDAATAAADQIFTPSVVAWRSTAAIASLKVSFNGGGNFVVGTLATLYGIA